ncbi:winged helix-turn-helix domain-containing protein [Streptomyces sp. AM8-1-1]|uniref:winged helix-turn-helix domain-containing protein n=1 Tax=Streptomyces sp. AM8-1-1 TaxID=3075825 RepID=UPI0039B6F040
MPTPPPTLRTQTRALPGLHRHRHQPHQPPPTNQVKQRLINPRPLRLARLFLLCRGLSWRRLGVFGRSSCSRRMPRIRRSRAVGVCAESVRRCRRVWEEGGASALRRRAATGRPPKLDDAQVETVRAALEQGAQAHGFEADLWTLERVGAVVERATGVCLSRASVWRLLTGRLGWSLQRPERRAVERDESEIARWVAHEWPRIKRGR